MNEEKMQELQNRVVESIQDYFDSYDWDWQVHRALWRVRVLK